MQNLLLKSLNNICNMANNLYEGRKISDPQELSNLIKNSIRKCADSAMIMGKFNYDLLAHRRDNITPELNVAYKHLSFPQGEHPKLLFGDDLPKTIKELTETNKVGQYLAKKPFYTSSSISVNPENKNKNYKPFLYRGRGQRGRFKPYSRGRNQHQQSRNNQSFNRQQLILD